MAPPDGFEIVIASRDVEFLASILRGEIDGSDIELTSVDGIEIGMQPAVFGTAAGGGEVLIEVSTPQHHLLGGCDARLAQQVADFLDSTSPVQVPVVMSCHRRIDGTRERDDVSVFFVAER